ncbi:MAG: hypothetical protein ACJ8IK_27905 [Burkholderiaceae bacterium]
MSRATLATRALPRAWCDANAEIAAESDYRDFDRGARIDGAASAMYPVLLELAAHARVVDLREGGIAIPPAYPDEARIAVAWLDDELYAALRADAWEGIVARWELQLPVRPLRPSVPAVPSDWQRARPHPAGGRRVVDRADTVIGVIDDGCAFADPRYQRTSGGSRILAFWDQTDGALAGIPGVTAPWDFGRGAELLASDIDAWLATCRDPASGAVDEAACYRRAGYARMPEGFVHGAAVLDLAAGPLSGGARYPKDLGDVQCPPALDEAGMDTASRCELVLVQVARAAVVDSTAASLPMQLLDGLRYIARRAAGARRVIVNISDGTSRALHDGHAILEDAIRELHDELAREGTRLAIVVAAGNAHMQARHAVLRTLAPRTPDDRLGADVAVLRLPVDNEQPAFVNLAMPPAVQRARLRITPPAGLGGAPFDVEPGQVVTWRLDGEACAWFAIPPAGDAPTLAVIAWAPTAAGVEGRRRAPAGNWRIQCVGRRGAELPLWISLAEETRGTPAAMRQARFVDADGGYDPERWMRDLFVDPAAPRSVIRRSGTLTVPATMSGHAGVVAVGAEILRLPALAPSRYFPGGEGRRSAYSSIGARPDVPRALRPVDAARNQAGIRAAGSPAGQVVRVTGTSFAAPQVVRDLANEPLPATSPKAAA